MEVCEHSNAGKVTTCACLQSCAHSRRPVSRHLQLLLCMQALTYKLAEGSQLEDLEEKDRYYLSDAYKRTVLQASWSPFQFQGDMAGQRLHVAGQTLLMFSAILGWCSVQCTPL